MAAYHSPMHQTVDLPWIIKQIEKIEASECLPQYKTTEDCNGIHSLIMKSERPERRVLYVDKKYVPLEEVSDWKETCPPDKRISDVRTKSDKEIKLASELNTKVAISKEKWYHIECDSVLVGPDCGFPKMPDSTDVFMFSVTMVGKIEVNGGFRLPANYVFCSEDGVLDGDRIIEFLKQSVELGFKSLTVEWPFYERAGQDQDQQSLYSTAVMAAVKTWLTTNDKYKSFDKIIFCARDDACYDNLMDLMPEHFPVYRLDTPLEAGFKRVIESIRDSTKQICEAIAEQTKQMDRNRKTNRRDEADETSPIKKIKEEN